MATRVLASMESRSASQRGALRTGGLDLRTVLGVVVGAALGCVVGILVATSGGLERLEKLEHRVVPVTSGEQAPPAKSREGPPVLPPAASGEHSRFAELAAAAAPGVVNVHTSKTVTRPPFPDFPFPDLFRQFFGAPPGARRGTPPERFDAPALGTGFVISKDGEILTNNHVVEGVDSIEVIFADGAKAKAEVVGQDPKTDIALIRVKDRKDLHPLPLGDSDGLLPGDWVIAIGNPFGLDHTVTAGIVSAKGRDIGQGPYDDFIQTDAAINPGNSGGPLLDMNGRVVGINSAINPQANTIGFAVPIDMAKEIVPQLERQGHVTRGWLGVGVQPVTPELAEALGLEAREGALVSQVMPDGPAAKAGIERGDVIVRFGDHAIAKMRELPRVVSNITPGTKVEVVRKGAKKTLEVTVAEMKGEQAEPTAAEKSRLGAFGIQAQDLTPELRERLGVDAEQGAVITNVEPGGAADRAGLRPEDVVLEVNREPVTDAADLASRLAKSGQRALLLVQRGDATLFVALDRGKS